MKNQKEICKECNGKGRQFEPADFSSSECQDCNGTGYKQSK